ncbi:MAG: hypothetical protein BAA01_00310 [Bacillus thermozeamaize]|uniref:YdbS-like PH domain-containing protein n=1 Tax=Bacillus thermozeamaize TaxID=230954 RepID=A0A1Y3Q0I6_9BACI|nr:MAG: hypothetical protein BAA01_00310 [Bacillus thermozeamaize]
MTSEVYRLHPVALLMFTIQWLRSILSSVALPAGVWVVNEISKHGFSGRLAWVALGVLVSVGISVLWGILSWWRYTYRIEDGELRIEHGVIFRKKRYIPIERIQTIDMEEGILHRLFRVVRLRVDTAGGLGAEAEARLHAVRREEAERIRELLLRRRQAPAMAPVVNDGDGGDGPIRDVSVPSSLEGAAKPGPVEGEEVRYARRISLKELAIFSATSGRIGIVASVIAGAVSLFGESFEFIFQYLDVLIGQRSVLEWVIILIPSIILLSWMLTAIATMFVYGNFTVSRTEGHIFIEKGWLERKRLTIPLTRVQAVTLVEGWLRQPFGYYTIGVETAGYGGDDGTETLLFPLLHRNELAGFLAAVIPEFADGWAKAQVHPLPLRARRRYVLRKLGWVIVPVVLLPLVLFPWGLLALVLVPLALFWGWLCHRDAGWALIDGEMCVLRSRLVARKTALVTRRRVQLASLRQSPFQRRKRLVTFGVSVASGAAFRVVDLEEAGGERLYAWVKPRAVR